MYGICLRYLLVVVRVGIFSQKFSLNPAVIFGLMNVYPELIRVNVYHRAVHFAVSSLSAFSAIIRGYMSVTCVAETFTEIICFAYIFHNAAAHPEIHTG